MYYQINILVQNIRKDLYYTCNNAILSFDTKELSYRNYTVDEEKTKEVIEDVLNKNYIEAEGSIIKISITDLDVEYMQDSVIIAIQIQVRFKSVINLTGTNEHEFEMSEQVKISLMNYKGDA